MFTECPECSIGFRVTAKVLAQAGGRVRCGGCGNAFSALDHLTEELPSSDEQDGTSSSEEDKFRETSRQLLKTLDELAGPEDVVIEDTGMEWRVLDDEEEDGEDDAEDAVAAEISEGSEELLTLEGDAQERPHDQTYDDNTPLEGDQDIAAGRARPSTGAPTYLHAVQNDGIDQSEKDVAADAGIDQHEKDVAADAGIDQHEKDVAADAGIDQHEKDVAADAGIDQHEKDVAADAAPAEASGEVEEDQADLALDEAEEWTDLLEDDDGAATDDMPLEVEEELAAIHNELSAKEDSGPVDLDAQFEMQAEAMGIDITGSQEIADEETDIADAEEDDPSSAGPLDEDADEVEDEEEMSAGRSRPSMGSATYVHPVQKDALTAAQERELDEMIHLSLAESAGDAGEEPEPAAEPESATEPESAAEPEHSAGDDVPEQSEEEMTINQQIDQELLAAAAQDQDLRATIIGLEDPSDPFDENSPDVETIIMEGDVVRGAMEREREKEKRERALARFDNAGNLIDSYAANRAVRGGWRSTDPVGYGMIAGSTLLVLLLLVQVVHAYREELSTNGLFNQTFGPIYRMLGNPVTPEWDIKGWQFEATNGSVAEGENVLTISSRIGNRSEQPLPYPLVRVSLTDRWEEIIGSRGLEPNEYLAGDLDPSKPVVPGDNFTAVITVEEPSVDATGFKVNVCYRVSPGRVRCATEDFKN